MTRRERRKAKKQNPLNANTVSISVQDIPDRSGGKVKIKNQGVGIPSFGQGILDQMNQINNTNYQPKNYDWGFAALGLGDSIDKQILDARKEAKDPREDPFSYMVSSLTPYGVERIMGTANSFMIYNEGEAIEDPNHPLSKMVSELYMGVMRCNAIMRAGVHNSGKTLGCIIKEIREGNIDASSELGMVFLNETGLSFAELKTIDTNDKDLFITFLSFTGYLMLRNVEKSREILSDINRYYFANNFKKSGDMLLGKNAMIKLNSIKEKEEKISKRRTLFKD